MKNIKKIAAFISGMGLLFSSVIPALAETVYPTPFPTGGQTTKVSQKIHGGNLTLKAPSDVTLVDIYTSALVVTNTGTATDFFVDDARGTKAAAGWTATVTMSKLTDKGDQNTFIPFTDTVSTEHMNGQVYTLTPTDPANLYGSSITGVSKGSETELVDANNDGISDDGVTVMKATSTNGKGMFKNNIGIKIEVPVNTPAADYESTMTFTVA